MYYNLNDSYYINLALDQWLTNEEPDYTPEEEQDEKISQERCITND